MTIDCRVGAEFYNNEVIDNCRDAGPCQYALEELTKRPIIEVRRQGVEWFCLNEIKENERCHVDAVFDDRISESTLNKGINAYYAEECARSLKHLTGVDYVAELVERRTIWADVFRVVRADREYPLVKVIDDVLAAVAQIK